MDFRRKPPLSAAQSMRSNITKLPNAWMSDFKDAKLIEAGLLGPLQTKWAKYITP